LRPFLADEQRAFYCPSQDARCEWRKNPPPPFLRATDLEVRYGYDAGEPVLHSGTFFSYGYNNWGGNQDLGSVRNGTHRALGIAADPEVQAYPAAGHIAVGTVKSPSEMIAIADSTADGRGDLSINPQPDLKSWGWPAKVHNGGCNVLFCDGHVQWYLQADLTFDEYNELRSLAIRRMWNNNHEPD
jgi:prepilin-type processing-associated H-X9-DG protein